jgi:general secretion pathway protein D
MNRLRLIAGAVTLVLMVAVVVFFAVPAEARTRKGDKFWKDGKAAEVKGDWDTALELFMQAVDEDGTDASYLLSMRKARFEAGQKHVDAGQKLREQGKIQEAFQEFQKALIADPASGVAIQEIKRTQEMMRSPGSAAVRPEDRFLTPTERARRESEDRVISMMAPPELKPTTALIPTLKMNNQPPRILYETVGKLAGINVMVDSQYNPPGRNFNVDLSNASVDQAFDYLALLTHTFWKPISPNTIFVTEDNVTKRRDYEDDVVKVFYITNATSVQEFQEIATAIRTVAEIRRVFTYNAQRAMVVRDTIDKVALAEKLVRDLDKPKAEVLVDIIVMEANSQRTRDLAATLATAGTAGINLPVNFTPNGISTGTTTTGTTSTSASSAIPLSRLGSLALNQFTTSLPGGILKLMLSDSRTRVINNPQVRASDGQKVTLKIGNRIPYATGSFQTNTAAALVSTQFNYADVGVNVDLTPQVHSADEVTLHVEVTVSSVQQYVEIGSISQPVIGQRSNTADIRLREGEVNILGGLSQTQDSRDSSGIPGLVNIPVLGSVLFGSNRTDKIHGDLLIALVPHIVRTPDYTADNLKGIYVGTDQVVKINYAPKAAAPGVADGMTPGNPTAATPVVTSPVATPAVSNIPGSPIAGAPGSNPPVVTSPVAPTQPAQTATPAPVVAGLTGSNVRASFMPVGLQTVTSGVVNLQLRIDNAQNAMSLSPLKIKFDPQKLRLEDINPGDLLSSDGGRVTSVKDIRNDIGEATITIARSAGQSGVSGSGTAATILFTAIGEGEARVNISDLGLKDASGQSVAAALGETVIRVQ